MNKMEKKVLGICMSSAAGVEMYEVHEAKAIAGYGLDGDRYAAGQGKFNKDKPGKRQLTLINNLFVMESGFTFPETRSNLLVQGVELNALLKGVEFRIGDVVLRGIKYRVPCDRPMRLAGKTISFREAFMDRAGIIAEVVTGGVIRVGSVITHPADLY